jgi:hypothetical protein
MDSLCPRDTRRSICERNERHAIVLLKLLERARTKRANLLAAHGVKGNYLETGVSGAWDTEGQHPKIREHCYQTKFRLVVFGLL